CLRCRFTASGEGSIPERQRSFCARWRDSLCSEGPCWRGLAIPCTPSAMCCPIPMQQSAPGRMSPSCSVLLRSTLPAFLLFWREQSLDWSVSHCIPPCLLAACVPHFGL